MSEKAMKVISALFMHEVPITITLPNGEARTGAMGFRESHGVSCELVGDKLFVKSAGSTVVVPITQVIYLITEETKQ